MRVQRRAPTCAATDRGSPVAETPGGAAGPIARRGSHSGCVPRGTFRRAGALCGRGRNEEESFHVERSAEHEIRIRLEAHGFDPAPSAGTLARLCALLEEWNRHSNLSGQRSAREIAAGICADAIALAAVLPKAPGIADLGSGAGFPGIPLAILNSATTVVLVEARERRHHFQRAAQRDLDLPNLVPLLGRAEELPPRPQPLALAQAIAEPAQAIRWLLPWAQPDGQLCLPLAVSARPGSW